MTKLMQKRGPYLPIYLKWDHLYSWACTVLLFPLTIQHQNNSDWKNSDACWNVAFKSLKDESNILSKHNLTRIGSNNDCKLLPPKLTRLTIKISFLALGKGGVEDFSLKINSFLSYRITSNKFTIFIYSICEWINANDCHISQGIF